MTTPQSPQKSKKDHLQKFHYAWIIAVVTFIVLLASAGVRNAASVIIRPLETEFAWDRATISFAFSISLILFGLGGALGGTLVDRFGPRRIVAHCKLKHSIVQSAQNTSMSTQTAFSVHPFYVQKCGQRARIQNACSVLTSESEPTGCGVSPL
jgi:sugar phosphate permease